MHEVGIMTGVLDAVEETAKQAGASRVLKITLAIGDMTEIIDDSLMFAHEILSEGTMCEGSELIINKVTPKSLCLDCGNEFSHDRFHLACPACGSYSTSLLEGRDMRIENIEVDLPEGDGEEVEGHAN